MLVKPEQMLQCCQCRLLQSQAALAQNPLLYACASSSTIYFSVVFKVNKFIYFKKVKAINFINCQNVKVLVFKVSCQTAKRLLKKYIFKIKSRKSYRNELYKLSIWKSACNKSELSNRKTTANKIQLKIKNPKSYSDKFYKMSNCTINLE